MSAESVTAHQWLSESCLSDAYVDTHKRANHVSHPHSIQYLEFFISTCISISESCK